jgi:hypothetical protein
MCPYFPNSTNLFLCTSKSQESKFDHVWWKDLAGQGKRRFSIKFNFQMSNGVGLVFVEKPNKKYLI